MAEIPKQANSSSSIMYLVIGIAVLLMAVIVPFSMKGKGQRPPRPPTRPTPASAGRPRRAGAAAKAAGPRDGATVWIRLPGLPREVAQPALRRPATRRLGAAHRAGIGDAAQERHQWQGAMPPKGGGTDLSDAELKAAVEHLVGLAKSRVGSNEKGDAEASPFHL